jgi:hypothetical protein
MLHLAHAAVLVLWHTRLISWDVHVISTAVTAVTLQIMAQSSAPFNPVLSLFAKGNNLLTVCAYPFKSIKGFRTCRFVVIDIRCVRWACVASAILQDHMSPTIVCIACSVQVMAKRTWLPAASQLDARLDVRSPSSAP